jgi:tetratricopeptide (TPR) repeat protein
MLFCLMAASASLVTAQTAGAEAHQRGTTLYAAGKYKEAADALRQAVQANPGNADWLLELGNAYRESRQLREAIQAYQESLKFKPRSAEALYGLGVACGMAALPQEAVRYLKESLALKPKNPKALHNLGVAYSDLGQLADAISAFQAVARLDPKDADNFFDLGVAYQKLNKLPEAEKAFSRTLALHPADGPARQQLILVSLAMGKRDEAMTHYAALEKLHPQLAAGLRFRVFSVPTSLMTQRVTLSLPQAWQVQKKEDQEARARIQMLIPYPAADNTPHSANAALIADLVPDRITIKELGDKVYEKSLEDLSVMNDIADGPNWRTIVWRATNGVPYLSLDRFGVANGVAVELLVSFPLLENGDTNWVERVIDDFNEACESLKIDGTNASAARVFIEKLPEKTPQ